MIPVQTNDRSRRSKVLTKTSTAKRVTISQATRRLYAKRDKRFDTDADAPALPPAAWENAVVGKYYRSVKTQISLRIDKEVLDWVRSQGDGYLTRINDILRRQMIAERK